MSCRCGCCDGGRHLTPLPIANRPGLPSLCYRAGTHASFLETMKARLSAAGQGALADLKTRRSDDPAIALLDAWALAADVLTFYQERIANEGYLRTATERRSILELARLVGYTLRPGVAATTYLAYTLDEDRSVTPPQPSAVTIPAGSRAQSVPDSGELPQSFETSEDLDARSSWNNLQVRLTRPQTSVSIGRQGLYVKGVAINLKVNDPLLIDFGDGTVTPFRVVRVTLDAEKNRTCVSLSAWGPFLRLLGQVRRALALLKLSGAKARKTALPKSLASSFDRFLKSFEAATPEEQLNLVRGMSKELSKQKPDPAGDPNLAASLVDIRSSLTLVASSLESDAGAPAGLLRPVVPRLPVALTHLLPSLEAPPGFPPANSTRLERSVAEAFSPAADAQPRLLAAVRPELKRILYPALKNITVAPAPTIRVYRLNQRALFGNTALQKMKIDRRTGVITEQGDWPIIEPGKDSGPPVFHEQESVINLDASYDDIVPGGWLVVSTALTHLTQLDLQVVRADTVEAGIGRSEYGISGKTTQIVLGAQEGESQPVWIDLKDKTPQEHDFDAIRKTVVYTQGEELELVEAPIPEDVGNCGPGGGTVIELADLFDGLDAGRWLIVSGERVIEGTSGVGASELVMLAGVEHRPNPEVAGDGTRTFLTLAEDGLAYCYKRDTVVIHGNVVKATQGESRKEVLGGGDATKSMQQFSLKQPPLTFVSASNPQGVTSTLIIRVNDVQWHEVDTLQDAGSRDRSFITRTDDDAKTTVVFGTGERGARLPTGQENVRAEYRNGIGKSGNVAADRVTLLATRPLGVKEVTNPLAASGGADPESRDQARGNAPLAVSALDRLVSVQDYADFARTFAGIGKAAAVLLSSGGRQLVHVTIAGADDIPIAESSDLFRNLAKALRVYGDPLLPIQVGVRELLALLISARVRLLPDYEWESVEPRIRARLLDTFGFERRALAQPVFLGEVMAAIQGVRGVAWVDVDLLRGISESELASPSALAGDIQKLAADSIPDPFVDAEPARSADQAGNGGSPEGASDGVFPAQLAILVPEAPDTLLLSEVPLES